jgi:hypothetical protein
MRAPHARARRTRDAQPRYRLLQRARDCARASACERARESFLVRVSELVRARV